METKKNNERVAQKETTSVGLLRRLRTGGRFSSCPCYAHLMTRTNERRNDVEEAPVQIVILPNARPEKVMMVPAFLRPALNRLEPGRARKSESTLSTVPTRST